MTTWYPLRKYESQPCVTMPWAGLSFLLLMRPWCAVASVLRYVILTTKLALDEKELALQRQAGIVSKLREQKYGISVIPPIFDGCQLS